MTFRNNIGKACHTSDVATIPQSSCGPPACSSLLTMPVGWVDPANFDFHLRADSIAVNAGSAEYAPARDKDGKARSGRTGRRRLRALTPLVFRHGAANGRAVESTVPFRRRSP